VVQLAGVPVDAREEDCAAAQFVHDQVHERMVAHELLGLERPRRAEREEGRGRRGPGTLLVQLEARLVDGAVQVDARVAARAEAAQVGARLENFTKTKFLQHLESKTNSWCQRKTIFYGVL